MAKVTITIEDQGNKVKTVATPSAEFMLKKLKYGEMTSAEGYALCALNAISAASKKQGKLIISVPRIKLN